MKHALLLLCLTALWVGCGAESQPFSPSDIGGGSPVSGSKTGSTTAGTAGNTSGAGTTAGTGGSSTSSSTGGTTAQDCPANHTNQGQLSVGDDDTVDVNQTAGQYAPPLSQGQGAMGAACDTADDCGPSSCLCSGSAYGFEASACVGGVCLGSTGTCSTAEGADACLCN